MIASFAYAMLAFLFGEIAGFEVNLYFHVVLLFYVLLS
jgi:hypothetical protein